MSRIPLNSCHFNPPYPLDLSSLPSLTGVDVATLQQYLTALGYMPKHVTGVFDDETKKDHRDNFVSKIQSQIRQRHTFDLR